MKSVVSKIPHLKVLEATVKENLTIDNLYETIDLYDTLIDSHAVLCNGYDPEVMACYKAHDKRTVPATAHQVLPAPMPMAFPARMRSIPAACRRNGAVSP